MATDSTPARAGSKRGFRIVLWLFLSVLISFVVWTAQIVIRQIFVEGAVPTRAERLPPLSPPCETGLLALGQALDVGLQAGLWADDEESAMRRFDQAIAEPWSKQAAVEQACNGDAVAKSAFAAMMRQRRVQEGWVRRHARETISAAGGARRFLPVESPPRRDVSR